jgi:hypothetical protein
MMMPSSQKIMLGILAYWPAIFKYILNVVFCECVQRRLRFCLNHLTYIKMAAFQFYLQSGKQESRVNGEDVFRSKISWWKEA